MNVVQFFDLKRRYTLNKHEIDAAVGNVLSSGWFILGKEMERFEARFAEYLGVGHVVGVNSGTDAIFMALRALGVGPGDEVITVANTATPTVSAIRMSGAVPVFTDIDSRDFNIDPDSIEEKITPKTRVLLPVHLYGFPARMDRIAQIAQARGLHVVEDAAQAQGASFANRTVGTIGDVGCFSFYPTKNLGAFGDAGAIATDNENLAETVRQLRNYGEISKYNNVREGVNSRLDEIQAGILNWGLDKLASWNKRRRELAGIYLSKLKGLPILLPPEGDDLHSGAWHLFVIRCQERDDLRNYLGSRGIQTAIHYPKPIYEQPAYSFLSRTGGGLPVTAKVMSQILSLPLYPELREDEVIEVCEAIRSFFASRQER